MLERMRLALVGTGLIGASLGLAARAAGVERVVGWDTDPEALAVAAERGALDAAAGSLAEAVAGAELAVVAAPIAQLPAVVDEVLAAAPETCTVTDVGSTKGSVCAAAGGSHRFVGGHPICGAEARGPEHAKAEIFRGATWFLTPLAGTDPASYRLVHGFAASLGAVPVAVDPQAHDRLVALTSHVPHVLANLIVNQAGGQRIEGHEPLAAAGGSLRDMTRVAGANPRIWVDIFLENAGAILEALARAPAPARAGRGRARGGRRGLPGPLDRRGGLEPPPHARARVPRSRARCSGCASTCPTGRACSPGSRRRSGPSGSTSRTSSCTTTRPSAAACSSS